MDLKCLEKILKGEPDFRLKQAKKAMFFDLIEDWNQATVLSLALRERLNKECPLGIEAKTFVSDNGRTVKALITLADGLKVETVLMRYSGGRNTVCVSSQIGCPMKCVFCATGRMGFKRSLEVMEIIEQVLFFARYLKKFDEKVTNVVFMGMGEPFLNYDNVIEAIKILNNKDGLNIGARKISISTVGVKGGIEKLTKEPLQLNLAISLHASNNNLRSKIIPANKIYPLEKVLAAVKDYLKNTRRKVMFEYIIIKEVNDSLDQAQKLIQLLSGLRKSLFLVNLIAYNPTGVFKPSAREQIKKFRQILEKAGIEVTERYRFGREIKGACGQLGSRI